MEIDITNLPEDQKEQNIERDLHYNEHERGIRHLKFNGNAYIPKEDYDNALAMFNRVLSINGSHIQSLVLSASIFNEKKDTKNAISYLKAAKQILETNKLEDSDTYKSIVQSLDKLGANNETTDSGNTSKEETKKTQ